MRQRVSIGIRWQVGSFQVKKGPGGRGSPQGHDGKSTAPELELVLTVDLILGEATGLFGAVAVDLLDDRPTDRLYGVSGTRC